MMWTADDVAVVVGTDAALFNPSKIHLDTSEYTSRNAKVLLVDDRGFQFGRSCVVASKTVGRASKWG